jgi:UDP-N-acetylmuramoyl-L-alanyl-D-glutamate--2,6-diaminopimelate ligase
LNFKEVVRGFTVLASGGPENVDVAGIAYDSRRVAPGYLFVAVEGFATDGHLFLEQAVAAGAAAVIVQQEVSLPPGVAWVRVADSRLALALAASRFYGQPSARMRLVGVTGTNGKTTTTHLIQSVYRQAGQRTGLIGTVHTLVGERELPVSHTTPESAELQRLLAEMAGEQVETVVMEVSSHALSLRRVAGCRFAAAVFTNLTRDHLDFHRDMDDYLEAKIKLFDGSGSGPGSEYAPPLAIINADDPVAEKIISRCPGRVVTYGIKSEADVRAGDVVLTARGVSFTVTSPWGGHKLTLKLTGLFNVYNALAAFAAGVAGGVDPALAVRGLEGVAGVAGRFELVDRGQDFTVVVDYAHTPDGLENILKTAREIKQGRLITVFGCGGDRDRAKRPMMGELAARLSDLVVITSDNPRTEEPLAIIKEIEQGVIRAGGAVNYRIIPDRREAIAGALRLARAGDVVMIAGKGHETYQIIGARRFPFDDREAASIILEELKHGRR